MRILRIIASMEPSYGGPCQGIRNVVPEQTRLGIINEVVCLDAPDTKYPVKDNFKIIGVGPAKNPWLYSKYLTPWLENNITNYDVVIVHGLWLYYSYAAVKLITKLRKAGSKTPALFVMPHGMLDPYFQSAESRKLKAIRNLLYWKLIENKVISNADGVLFTCQEELELARTTFTPYQPKKELNVGYGISSPPDFTPAMKAAFLKQCPTLKSDDQYLLFLSRIHPKKGVDLLIEAYHDVKQHYPQMPKLVIAGPGLDSAYGKQMQDAANGSENIIFSGLLTNEVKWGAFYGCSAFILPSHQENFGISVVEALACFRPVLITNKVNIWREIQNARAGMVCTDDAEGIKAMLTEWYTLTPQQKEEMQLNAYSAYNKYFSIESSNRTFIEKIQTVTEQN